MVTTHKKATSRSAFILALAMASLPFANLSFGEASSCSQDADSAPARGQAGSISVTTTPEKAVVYLGGNKLGLSPIDTTVSSGRVTLTIMLNGEELVNERVNICAGQKTVIEKKLLLPYGSVQLTTNPVKCNCHVTVDGEDVGSTKGGVLTINRLEAGTRVFKVSNGKRSKELSVNVLPEETVNVSVNFK